MPLSLSAFVLLASLCVAGLTPAQASQPVDAAPLDIPGGMRGANELPSSDNQPVAMPSLPGDAPIAPAQSATPAAATPATGAPAANTPSALTAPAPAFLRVMFADDDATLSDDALNNIKAFADGFKERGGRVALKGYAGPPYSSSSNMRRLSLRRVLAVREQLLDFGISADRLDVRALGGTKDTGPQDRVDITKSGG